MFTLSETSKLPKLNYWIKNTKHTETVDVGMRSETIDSLVIMCHCLPSKILLTQSTFQRGPTLLLPCYDPNAFLKPKVIKLFDTFDIL